MLFSAEVSSDSSAGVPGVAVILFSAKVSSDADGSFGSGINSLECVGVWIVALRSSVSDGVSVIWRNVCFSAAVVCLVLMM